MSPNNIESATLPLDKESVPRLLVDIAKSGSCLLGSGKDDLAARLELLGKARELAHALETPREVMIHNLWSQPACNMAISFGAQTGLWSTMTKNGDHPQSVSNLANQLGMPEELLRRMMRHVSASGYLKMAAPDVYIPNNFTRALATPEIGAGYHVCPPILGPPLRHAPTWFQERNYQLPTSKDDIPFKPAHNTPLNFFGYLITNPPHGQHFNEHMAGYFTGRPAWMGPGFYPAKERLIDGLGASSTSDNDAAVLLVDVAGGAGHYTEQFHSHFPDAPGRLIVQDLPAVLESTPALHPKIEKMASDFFEEQPVRGARAYYTHFVLHDWPDASCLLILRNLKAAMTPGYSKLLVHEHVLPETGHDHEQTGLDLLMMTCFGSKERSEREWRDLLEGGAGLRITGIWGDVKGVERVVECVRDD